MAGKMNMNGIRVRRRVRVRIREEGWGSRTGIRVKMRVGVLNQCLW